MIFGDLPGGSEVVATTLDGERQSRVPKNKRDRFNMRIEIIPASFDQERGVELEYLIHGWSSKNFIVAVIQRMSVLKKSNRRSKFITRRMPMRLDLLAVSNFKY